MDLLATRARIIQLQSLIPDLNAELHSLISTYQGHCEHPYVVGYKSTAGLGVIIGMVGCPHCGLTINITGQHAEHMPAPLHKQPVYWISSRACRHIFALPLAKRDHHMETYVLPASPEEA